MPSKKCNSERQLNSFSSAPLSTLSSIPFTGMSLFRASASASVLQEGTTPEEENKWFFNSTRSSRRKAKGSLHRTLSSPSTGSSYRNFRFADGPSRSLTCPSRPSYTSYRSLRPGDSPPRIGFFSPRRNRYKTSRVNQSISDSYDFIDKSQTEYSSRQSVRLPAISGTNRNDFNSNENHFDFTLTVANRRHSHSCRGNSTVERSTSSPAGLQPSYITRMQCVPPPHSPSSPGRVRYVPVHSHSSLSNELATYPIDSTVVSPSLSTSGDLQVFTYDRTYNEEDVQARGLNSITSLNSSRNSIRPDLNSSRNSVILDLEDYSTATDMAPSFSRPQRVYSLENNHLWQDVNSGNLNALQEEQEDRPRLSQLAFSNLTARDIRSLHFYSPPPSYEKLCNPESLPTYQEAVDGFQVNLKRFQDRTIVFTLPSTPDFSLASPHDRLFLQELERSQRGNLNSYSGDLSDSEGDYSSIMEAIPQHPIGDPWPEVSISFTSGWSQLRHFRRKLLCSKSICNKELVRKELNSRWPFIIRAREDDRCPGLLFVECSSNLSISQLPDPQYNTDWTPPMQTTRDSARLTDHAEPSFTDNEISTVNIEEAALNSNLMFYLCGKCVFYDSFDCESVKTHIELDCTGQMHKWAHISELYLLMRAIGFVLVIIMVIMILPIG